MNTLRSFLGCRYVLSPKQYAETTQQSLDEVSGWTRIPDQGAYAIWENENALPIGFAVDYSMPLQEFNALSDESQIGILLRAVVLDEQQQQQYSHIAPILDYELQSQREDLFWQDVANRKAEGLQDVWTDASGFGGTISLDKDKFVVFTVPYDTGFTAYVNDQPTEVLKVDNGMIAIVCPQGTNEIRFEYKTPLFGLSCLIALLAWIVFIGYLILSNQKKKRPKSTAFRYRAAK